MDDLSDLRFEMLAHVRALQDLKFDIPTSADLEQKYNLISSLLDGLTTAITMIKKINEEDYK